MESTEPEPIDAFKALCKRVNDGETVSNQESKDLIQSLINISNETKMMHENASRFAQALGVLLMRSGGEVLIRGSELNRLGKFNIKFMPPSAGPVGDTILPVKLIKEKKAIILAGDFRNGTGR